MAVVVLLIAGIALANRGGASGGKPEAAVDPMSVEIPHSSEGAQCAAAKMAAVLGSERMFDPIRRGDIVQRIVVPERRLAVQKAVDADYTTAFNEKLGLDENGKPPAGATFVSRAMPAGVTVRHYDSREATIDVWCAGLLGLTGKGAPKQLPVTTSWFTQTLTVRWTDEGWRLAEFTQQDGPEPTAGEYGQTPQL
ncbi:hypothetical protein ACIF83_36145 [Streptomyces sp. NPDC085866]|uniref:hypothetical protein n=1 Tax=Streptomyces sp. NPDC085866 TaxID=3365736 RepID=UPI0037D96F42